MSRLTSAIRGSDVVRATRILAAWLDTDAHARPMLSKPRHASKDETRTHWLVIEEGLYHGVQLHRAFVS